MAKHRTYSIEFKRQVAQEYLGGETLHGLARRHDVSRNLIRIWVSKLEAGTRINMPRRRSKPPRDPVHPQGRTPIGVNIESRLTGVRQPAKVKLRWRFRGIAA